MYKIRIYVVLPLINRIRTKITLNTINDSQTKVFMFILWTMT